VVALIWSSDPPREWVSECGDSARVAAGERAAWWARSECDSGAKLAALAAGRAGDWAANCGWRVPGGPGPQLLSPTPRRQRCVRASARGASCCLVPT
jgi:hypothetical protein